MGKMPGRRECTTEEFPEEPPSILVVDDDPSMLEMIEEAFTGLPIRIHKALSFGGAIGIVRNERVDLAILDVYLPDGTGTVLAQELKSTYPDALIVIMTGAPDGANVSESLDVSADAYLMKPVDVSEMVALVEDLLSNHRRKSGVLSDRGNS